MSHFISKNLRLFSRKKGGTAPQQIAKEAGPKAPEMKPQSMAQVQKAEPSLIDSYTVNDPFARVGISLEADGSYRYMVIEPTLSKVERKQLQELKQVLKDGLDLDASTFKPEEAEKYLTTRTRDVMKKFRLKMQKPTFEKLFYFIDRDFLHYGVVDPIFRDPNIEDISCNGPSLPIYVFHRQYESLPSNVQFKSQEELEKFVLRLAYMSGRHISVADPVVDASLPDGSRVQMTFGSEITKKGSTFTIRKFKPDPYSIIDLINFGTLNPEVAAILWYVLENKGSVLLAGGTASGKTTTINCLALFIRPEAKIVTIEDTPEINLASKNWIQSVSRQGIAGMGEVSLYDLLRAALRQRPDFIIVGEVRGEEANTMFQALSTGHSGMSSIHADSIPAVFHRLTNPPMNIPRTLLPSLNFVIQQNRFNVKDRPARRFISVTEVVGLDTKSNEIITNEVFKYDSEADTLIFSGRCYTLEKYAKMKGVAYEDIRQEIAIRRQVIEWASKQGLRKYRDVANVIQRYYTDRTELIAEIGAIAA